MMSGRHLQKRLHRLKSLIRGVAAGRKSAKNEIAPIWVLADALNLDEKKEQSGQMHSRSNRPLGGRTNEGQND